MARPTLFWSCELHPTRQGSLWDSAALRVLARLAAPLDLSAVLRPPFRQVECKRLNFVRDPCVNERKTGVISGHWRLGRTAV